jgi:4'-phosphopantetheinyl transferase
MELVDMDVLADPDIGADVDTATSMQEWTQSRSTGHEKSKFRQQSLESMSTHSDETLVPFAYLRYNAALIVVANELIEIWMVPLALPDEAEKRLYELLNTEERLRSRKFHFAQDQRRYTISRGALRCLLARYLDNLPGDIVFGYGEFGKPFLVSPPEGRDLSFNLSHCIDMSVIAVAPSRNLGVDVEKVRTIPELEQIAKTHFTSDECSFMESATGAERVQSFLRIWTRREATAKAFGQNLSEALSRVAIPVYPPGDGTRLEEKGTWFVTDLRLDPGHIGALCAEGEPCEIAYRNFLEFFPV